MPDPGTIRVGISGWRYAPWRGSFYPRALPQAAELSYAGARFAALEINGTFYSLQRPSSFARWARETPADFVFAIKGSRYITHMLKLRGIRSAMANFFASGLCRLGSKLGPILWQLPPSLRYDSDRMRAFCDLLPGDGEAALALARRRDRRLAGRAALAFDRRQRLRHAIEIRHESFLDTDFIDLLRQYNIALVVAETARRWPMPCDVTADFIYLRLHGDRELYRSGYGPKALERWARRIRAWARGAEPRDVRRVAGRAMQSAGARDVYCFFDNTDAKLRAPFDALALARRLRGGGGRLPH